MTPEATALLVIYAGTLVIQTILWLVAAENCHGVSTLGGTNANPRPAPPSCP